MSAHLKQSAVGSPMMLREVVRAMRPVQWVKNVFVFAPLIFGLRLLDTTSLWLSVITFGCFSLVSSAVYLLNDLVDRESDALHPTKRERPIASGRLPVDVARVALLIVGASGLAGAMLFDWYVGLTLTVYFVLNVAYSMKLKTWAFVDISCIATGFLLRVLAGGIAINVPVSGWLLACTFLLAMLLALGKRKHELLVVAQNGKEPGTRVVLERYNLGHIEVVLKLLAGVTVASYTAYTLSASTIAHFGTWTLIYTVPSVVFGLWRYFRIVGQLGEAQSPTDTMVHDTVFVLNVVLWAVFVTILIYVNR